MEQPSQELMMKFQMYEQHINQINQQLQAVEQAILELASINTGLEDLKGAKGKEIMAQIGRGIFARAELLDEKLVVDIGEKKFVKKSIPDTQNILKKQIDKLQEAQEQLNSNLEQINQELTKTFMEAQGKEKPSCKCKDLEENCECENHDEKCECGEECGGVVRINQKKSSDKK